MKNIEAPAAEPRAEARIPERAAEEESVWPSAAEEAASSEVPRIDTGGLPSWLRGIDQGEEPSAAQADLPAWLRDDVSEVAAEPTRIEPTRAEEWQPVAEPEPAFEEQPAPLSVQAPEPASKRRPATAGSAEGKKPAAKKAEAQPEPYREPATRKGVGVLTTDEDPILSAARNELSRSNIPGALDTYSKLIKRARFLDEVIFDLREALYRYPVEVSIWQSLGDAYMRANRLQDALDAYTKAEELLR
jgi:hypothetical protein